MIRIIAFLAMFGGICNDRQIFSWIYLILLGSWVMVLMSHPTPSTSLTEVVSRAAIGPFPGQFVIAGMLAFYGALLGLGVYSYWDSRIRKSLPAGHPGRLSRVHHEEE